MDVDDREETLVSNAYAYLTQKIYPEGCTANEKRVIRKKSLKFQISDNGELLYRHKLVGKVKSSFLCPRCTTSCAKMYMYSSPLSASRWYFGTCVFQITHSTLLVRASALHTSCMCKLLKLSKVGPIFSLKILIPPPLESHVLTLVLWQPFEYCSRGGFLAAAKPNI